MALQVGELFASFTVDTSAAEQAMRAVAALGGDTAERLRQELGGETGLEIAAGLLAGLESGLNAQTGFALGSAFGQGVAQGVLSMWDSVTQAVGSLKAAAADGIMSAYAQTADAGKTAAGMLAGALPAIGGQGITAEAEKAARNAAAPGGGTQTRTGGSGASEASLARVVASALEGVTVRLDGTAVGNLVAPAVSRSIAENAWTRRVEAE